MIETVNTVAPNFKASVLGRRALTPLDLEREFGFIGGDIFHGALSLDQLFSARPVLGNADYRAPLRDFIFADQARTPGGLYEPRKQSSTERTPIVHNPYYISAPPETQSFNHVTAELPLGLSQKVRGEAVQLLNQTLVDTITLRDLYKKCHWQVSGPTFYQLHLLFDKHAGEQTDLVDEIAERIQTLGRNCGRHGP